MQRYIFWESYKQPRKILRHMQILGICVFLSLFWHKISFSLSWKKSFINHLHKSKSSLEPGLHKISWSPLRLIYSVFLPMMVMTQTADKSWHFYEMKGILNPNTFKWNLGFCLGLCCALFDLSTTFLNTTMPGPLPVFHCSVSHTKPDVHTPTVTAERDPVIVRGWEEFLFTSLPSCLTGCCTVLAWTGCGGWTRGQEGAGFQGDGRVGREPSGLFMQQCLYTTGMRGKVLAHVGRPIRNTLWWWC